MHPPGFTIEIWAKGPSAAFASLVLLLKRELDADRHGLVADISLRGYRSALRPSTVSVDEFIEQRRRVVLVTSPVEYLYLGDEHYIFFGAFTKEPPTPINGYI